MYSYPMHAKKSEDRYRKTHLITDLKTSFSSARKTKTKMEKRSKMVKKKLRSTWEIGGTREEEEQGTEGVEGESG